MRDWQKSMIKRLIFEHTKMLVFAVLSSVVLIAFLTYYYRHFLGVGI